MVAYLLLLLLVRVFTYRELAPRASCWCKEPGRISPAGGGGPTAECHYDNTDKPIAVLVFSALRLQESEADRIAVKPMAVVLSIILTTSAWTCCAVHTQVSDEQWHLWMGQSCWAGG